MPLPDKRNPDNRAHLTFINHASFLIQLHGKNILTDPIWSERTSPVEWAGPKRVRLPAFPLEQLPPIDVVLISHNHYDHMDVATLQFLQKRDQPIFLCGLGNAEFLRKFGLTHVVDMDWWDKQALSPLTLSFVPAKHFSRRGFKDAMKTLWGGFVVQSESQKIFFAGDTGYGRHFSMVYERFGAMDVSLLPIGAYSPRWFMGPIHMDPEQAVLAHNDLHSRFSIGMHFGTFQLTDEGIDAPKTELVEARKKWNITEQAFVVPELGQRFVI